jgi:antitoxin FitA
MTALLSLLAYSWYTHRMATLTIRNLDDKIKRKLQLRAALNGRSMEAEAREMISGVLQKPSEAVGIEPEEDLGTAIRNLFAPLGGVELQIPPRVLSSRPVNRRTGVSLKSAEPREGLGTAIHKLFAPLGGVELEIPTRRKSHRPIPTFE